MVKRICLAVLLMLTLCGCRRRPVAAVCLRQEDLPLMTQLEASLEGRGWRVLGENAGNDQSRQNLQIAGALAQGCDIMILEPVMTCALRDVLEMTRKADVPVIFLNYPPEEDLLQGKTCYIGSDPGLAGKGQSRVARELPDGGDINQDGMVSYTVISGPREDVDALRRAMGCISAMNGICLEVSWGEWSDEDGARLCGQQLMRLGEAVEVIFCCGKEMTQGALQMLKDSGYRVGRDVYLIGMGEDQQIRRQIQEGFLTAAVTPDYRSMAEDTAWAARSLLTGQPREKIRLWEYLPVKE